MVCPYFIPEEPRIHREQEFFRSLLVLAAELLASYNGIGNHPQAHSEG